jgi:hypothetical protein
MPAQYDTTCPLSGHEAKAIDQDIFKRVVSYLCPACGHFWIWTAALEHVPLENRFKLSYITRKETDKDQSPTKIGWLKEQEGYTPIADVLAEADVEMPVTPGEKKYRILAKLEEGLRGKSLGAHWTFHYTPDYAQLGFVNEADLASAVKLLEEDGMVEIISEAFDEMDVRLTSEGWRQAEDPGLPTDNREPIAEKEQKKQARKPMIFLSHAELDKEIARKLEYYIKRVFEDEVEIFLYSGFRGIEAGSEWLPDILNGLHNANAMVVLITAHSKDRNWIWLETGAFWYKARLDRNNRIYPICAPDQIEFLAPPLNTRQATPVEDPEKIKAFFYELCEHLDCGKPERRQYKRMSEQLTLLCADAREGYNNAQSRWQRPNGWTESPKARIEVNKIERDSNQVRARVMNVGSGRAYKIKLLIDDQPFDLHPSHKETTYPDVMEPKESFYCPLTRTGLNPSERLVVLWQNGDGSVGEVTSGFLA